VALSIEGAPASLDLGPKAGHLPPQGTPMRVEIGKPRLRMLLPCTLAGSTSFGVPLFHRMSGWPQKSVSDDPHFAIASEPLGSFHGNIGISRDCHE